MKLVYLEACVTKLTFGIHTIGLNFDIHTNGMYKLFKTLKLFPKVKIINLGETSFITCQYKYLLSCDGEKGNMLNVEALISYIN